PKPSLGEITRQYLGALPPKLPCYPRVSVVVCAYNAERTIDQCLASLAVLNYPDCEVIVVNDGSRDRTLSIAEGYGFCRIINQSNHGLSVARNVGAEAATGEIVAYTDSDCVADPDWLSYLVAKMETSNLAACGGPNFPPPEDNLVPAAVAVCCIWAGSIRSTVPPATTSTFAGASRMPASPSALARPPWSGISAAT